MMKTPWKTILKWCNDQRGIKSPCLYILRFKLLCLVLISWCHIQANAHRRYSLFKCLFSINISLASQCQELKLHLFSYLVFVNRPLITRQVSSYKCVYFCTWNFKFVTMGHLNASISNIYHWRVRETAASKILQIT